MPTSTTLVETSTSASLAWNWAITSSFSLGFMRPCRSASLRAGKTSACNRSCSAVAALASILSNSSTRGQMMNACRPSSSFFSMNSYAWSRRVVYPARLDEPPAGGHLVNDGHFQVAVDSEGEGARDGGGGHHEGVRHQAHLNALSAGVRHAAPHRSGAARPRRPVPVA